jgi:flagellum-specific ATP synthase
MTDVVSAEQVRKAKTLLEVLATYRRSEDLINIGAYAKGSNPKIDKAIGLMDAINDYLRQPVDVKAPMAESVKQLLTLI